MKYIKWQDELEGYLCSLPREEKDKAFSYFSEMYADKREAGMSEEEIVESFGPPYDVAKRILSESGQTQTGDGFFDAPPSPTVREYARPEREEPPRQKKKGLWHTIGGIILGLCLLSLSATLLGIPIGFIADGFVGIGATVGALAAGKFTGAAGAAAIGGYTMIVGVALILLAPIGYIVVALWKKFIRWF